MTRVISPAEYEPMMSDYLRSGCHQEAWSVNWIEWENGLLRASCRLNGVRPSHTDHGRYHVAVYPAREMDAQLGIIQIHLMLGLPQKTSEVWLLKCTEECLSPVTDPLDVRFEQSMTLRRTRSGKVLSEHFSSVTDAKGGLMKFHIHYLTPDLPVSASL